MKSSAVHPQARASFLVLRRASARSPPSATGDPCSPGEDVLCVLFCFSTGAHGGWHEAEKTMHVLVQLVVPGSRTKMTTFNVTDNVHLTDVCDLSSCLNYQYSLSLCVADYFSDSHFPQGSRRQ